MVCVRKSDGVTRVALEGRKGYCGDNRTNIKAIMFVFNKFAFRDVESSCWKVPKTALVFTLFDVASIE